MTKINWNPFDCKKGSTQKLPPEARYVLLQVRGCEETGMPPRVVVGWLKFAAGDKECPFFVIPGGDFSLDPDSLKENRVLFWADCLGDDFHAKPSWLGEQR